MLKKEKENLSDLIDLLKIKTKKNQSEISVEAGYEPQTLAQLKSKPGTHDSVIKQLRLVYKDILNNSIDQLILDQEVTYNRRSFEERIQANLDSLKGNQNQLARLAVLQLNQLALIRAYLEDRPVAAVQDEINKEIAGVATVKTGKGAGKTGKVKKGT